MANKGAPAAELQRKLLSQAIQDPLFNDVLFDAAKEIVEDSENVTCSPFSGRG